jgi:hypothetical protein
MFGVGFAEQPEAPVVSGDEIVSGHIEPTGCGCGKGKGKDKGEGK